jgi:xylan 1,4-beta-xylosidase
MNRTITNPILPGFHPDPSIVRVGDGYFLATSTFEWFPGVALFHSKDLAHWRPIGHALTRRSQLDLLGVGDSAGPWAPSLSHDGERFYLVVCQVRTRTNPMKDMRVMLYTADRIDGPWSEPTCLGGSGFDPSLFHDPETGRKWLANIQWDFRAGQPRFAGIIVQEYDPQRRQLIGEQRTILTKPVLLEGPNLYRHDGWYYLMCAEGGTGWNHGISMARSRELLGPYELDPQPLLLTTRQSPGCALQKAGHGELVQTPAGQWYLVHLASRPLYPERRCPLGRETCIQRVVWSGDGWLRLAHGGHEPRLEVPAPADIEPHPWPAEPSRDDFDSAELSPHWQSLRVPIDQSCASLAARPGWLRLRGRESIHSLFEQGLLARRVESFRCTVETRVEFAPSHFTQSAGLILYYDARQHYYLRIAHDERTGGRVIGVVQTDDGTYGELSATPIHDWPAAVYLRARIDHERAQFAASRDGQDWREIGPPLDFTKVSDDYGSTLRFTGAMAGVCCQDLNGHHAVADFDYFEIREGD